jgi:membrane dipeptidase
MWIFDAHLDLAWNGIDWNRDLTLPVEQIRATEREQKLVGKGRGENTVSFHALRQGGVGVVIATLIARLLRENQMPAFRRYEHMEAAHAAAWGQLVYYRTMEQRGILRPIRDAKDLTAQVSAWEKDPGKCPIGYILSMEGADPVLTPDELPRWYEAGLRIIGPAHYGPSPYAHGTGTVGGLFPPGPALLREMQRLGIILDVTHLADQAFDEAMDQYGGPVLASHHNCRALVPDQRQLSDEQIKRLIGRGAVIGVALDAWMLHPGWVRGETMPRPAGVNLARVVDHIDHYCQLAGNARHVAIGTDLDGGFGREQSPYDLDTIADLRKLVPLLKERGYSDADIDGILHGNWVRFFTTAWGQR